MTVAELIDILGQADNDYVVSISTEEISAYKKDGTKRTGGAIFLDGGMLIYEKDEKVEG